MAAGVWALRYDIAANDRDSYLDWFHDCHIPEKLARPGYRWAAHFEAAPIASAPDLFRYIGLFGGVSTRVFLDPSPAQLKLTQTDETRAMMALRQNASAAILAYEWSSVSSKPAEQRASAALIDAQITANYLHLISIDNHLLGKNGGPDETIGSFCAQKLAPFVAGEAGAKALHKMINVIGDPRAVIMFETDDDCDVGGMDAVLSDLPPLAEFADTGQLTSRRARRIWPQS